MQKKKLLYSGKVKSMYETEDPRYVIAEFRDDTTAFDGAKHEKIPRKGMINNKISACIFQRLSDSGIPTHYVKRLSDNEALLKRLKMIPLECVVRNRAAGGLCRRLGIDFQSALVPPLYELFYKSDVLHDPLVSEDHALAFHWASGDQLNAMRMWSLKINRALTEMFDDVSIVLADSKYEFGIDSEGVLCLGDEISPDSCRLWDAKALEPMDKDRFRQDLGGLIEAYYEVAKRLGAV